MQAKNRAQILPLFLFIGIFVLGVSITSAAGKDDEVWQQIAAQATQIPVLRPTYIPDVFKDCTVVPFAEADKLSVIYECDGNFLQVVAGSFNAGQTQGPVEVIPFRGTTAQLIKYPRIDGQEESGLIWFENGGPYTTGRPPNEQTVVTPYGVDLRGLSSDELLKVANSLVNVKEQRIPGELPPTGESFPFYLFAVASLALIGCGLFLRSGSQRR